MLYNKASGLKKLNLALIMGASLVCAAGAQATTIDFSEVALGTPDPTISGYSFTAGDGFFFEDTYTDDFLNPGNAYLASGWDSFDTLGNGIDTTLINIATAAVGGVGFDTSINLDAAFDFGLPSGLTLQMDVLLGGVVQDSDSIMQGVSPALEGMSVILNDIAFDEIVLYDTATIGETFRIDNLVVNATDNTGGGPGPNPVPEPSTLLLFGAAIFGIGARRRLTKK